METNIRGVYAAGDIRNKKHRQITTSVGDGTIAALEIIREDAYLAIEVNSRGNSSPKRH
jgi:thioredoxin reductase